MADPARDHLDGYAPTDVQEPAHAQEPLKDPGLLDVLRDIPQERLDSFVNQLTGIGDFTRDKTMGGHQSGILHVKLRYLTGSDCRDRWRGTDLGARIIEQIPSEMTREGFELTVQPTDDDKFELDGKVRQRADDLAWERRYYQIPRGVSVRTWKAQQRAQGRKFDEAAPIVPANRQGARPTSGPADVDDEDIGQAIVEAIEAKLRDLGAVDKSREGLCYERAYGGGAVLLGANDGAGRQYSDAVGLRLDATDPRNLTSPLNEKSIKSVKHLSALRGGWDGEVVAWSYYNDITSPRYGEPEIYMLRNIGVPISRPPAPGESAAQVQATYNMPNLTVTGGPLTYWVHESRLLVFPGVAADHFSRVQMRGWGDSVFMKIDEVLSQFGQTWGAIAIIMQEFALGVLKIDGLAKALANNDPKGQGVIASRALMLNLAQSIARVRMLDKNEDFSRVTVPLTGLADVLEQFGLRMAAAADMPVSLLFGQSPGGLRAGDDDRMFFYDRIKSKQTTNLLPQWRRLIRLLFLSKDSPTGGVEPKRWDVQPRPLWQPSEKEQAELRKTQAETDHIYITDGVITPEECAASRFSGSKYSTNTTIDMEARAAMHAAAPDPDDEGGAPAAPALPGAEPTETPTPLSTPSVELTPSTMSAIMTVNEARASKGMPPWPDADGNLTVAEFTAKRAAVVATAANAETGKVGKPPEADKPAPAPPISGEPPGAEPEPTVEAKKEGEETPIER